MIFDRIEVFAMKEKPKDKVGKMDAINSYKDIINNLIQVGNNSNNILARGHITATYKYGDNTVL